MQYCVVVANGNQAKFFTLENADFPDYQTSPNLVETQLINHPQYQPEWQSGETTVKINHDNRALTLEHDRRFASNIAQAASKITRRHKHCDLVLVSQSKMLGHLRHAIHNKLKGVNTQEVAKDLSNLSNQELHNYLAREKLIPKRNKPQH